MRDYSVVKWDVVYENGEVKIIGFIKIDLELLGWLRKNSFKIMASPRMSNTNLDDTMTVATCFTACLGSPDKSQYFGNFPFIGCKFQKEAFNTENIGETGVISFPF